MMINSAFLNSGKQIFRSLYVSFKFSKGLLKQFAQEVYNLCVVNLRVKNPMGSKYQQLSEEKLRC